MLPQNNFVFGLLNTNHSNFLVIGYSFLLLKGIEGTSLVVQRLRIRLPMQGTQVRSLVGELRSHMLRKS